MKEITTMPVKVSNGNKEIEVYESEGGFCMMTEFLGKCLGYKNPTNGMNQLFRRHKEVLEPHRFVIFKDDKPMGGKPSNSGGEFSDKVSLNPQGGRPSKFYAAQGCVNAAGLAGTSQSKEFFSPTDRLPCRAGGQANHPDRKVLVCPAPVLA